MKFKLGGRVKWTSQANGGTAVKEGSIVSVVAARCVPHQIKNSGCGRDHESYVVAVDAITDWTKKKRMLKRPKRYWPRVSGLEIVQ